MDDTRAILESARTVAILGAHTERTRPAHYVPAYLVAQGYRVLPVNPRLVGERLFDEDVRASLADLQEPVDIVDVFRRSDAVMAHLEEIMAMSPLPKCVWLQQGITSDELGEKMRDAGIAFVQDRCTLAEHRRLGLGRVASQ